MLVVISPAKKLDDSPASTKLTYSQPQLLDDAQQLVDQLRDLSPHEIAKLMHISDALGVLNYDRYQSWQQPLTTENAKAALFSFKGDVYVGLDAESFSKKALSFAQTHLCILSGLYGVLRPLDLMLAYRLEMGVALKNHRGKHLYDFWGDKITQLLNQQLAALKSRVLVNLASNEYFKSVNRKMLQADIITPVFKDNKNGQYKTISFYAKKARGCMTAYIMKNALTDPEALKQFDALGYRYNLAMSDDKQWVFTREQVDQ